VIVGSCETSAIVFGPEPIANRIVSDPADVLDALMASRSVQLDALQTPSSVSAVELTVKVAANAGRAVEKSAAIPIRRRVTGRSLMPGRDERILSARTDGFPNAHRRATRGVAVASGAPSAGVRPFSSQACSPSRTRIAVA